MKNITKIKANHNVSYDFLKNHIDTLKLDENLIQLYFDIENMDGVSSNFFTESTFGAILNYLINTKLNIGTQKEYMKYVDKNTHIVMKVPTDLGFDLSIKVISGFGYDGNLTVYSIVLDLPLLVDSYNKIVSGEMSQILIEDDLGNHMIQNNYKLQDILEILQSILFE